MIRVEGGDGGGGNGGGDGSEGQGGRRGAKSELEGTVDSSSGSQNVKRPGTFWPAAPADQAEPARGPRKYWPLTSRDVYIRVFDEILSELDLTLLPAAPLHEFRALSLEARYLATRLHLRVLRWVAIAELERYLPPEKLELAVAELLGKGWLRDDPELADVLDAASVRELQLVAGDFGIKTVGLAKPALVAALTQAASRRQFFGPPLAPKIAARFRARGLRLLLLNAGKSDALSVAAFMFLCPAHAGIDTVVRSNMKQINFATYAYVPQCEAPLFASKAAFAAYYRARVTCDPLEDLTSLPDGADDPDGTIVLVRAGLAEAASENTDGPSGPFSAGHVYGRGLALLSALLGRAQRFTEEYAMVEEYLSQRMHRGKRAELYGRKLLLELKFWAEQKEATWLHRGLNTYFDAQAAVSEVTKYDVDRKATRLLAAMAKAGIDPPSLPLSSRRPLPLVEIEAERRTSLGSGKTQWGGAVATSVEDAALAHYAAQGWDGGHFENGVLKSLFALLCYDIVFLVKTGFRCRFQSRPLAMQQVLDTRRAEINARLHLPVPELEARVASVHAELAPREPQILGVNWLIPLDALLAVVRALGAKLSLLLGRLLADYHGFGSGFPDLTLWQDEGSDSARCKFVEVKSENDVVSDNQYVWLEFMTDVEIDAEVCRVLPRGRAGKRAVRGNVDAVYPEEREETPPPKRKKSV